MAAQVYEAPASKGADHDLMALPVKTMSNMRQARPSVALTLLLVLLCAVFLAGGASRADVSGQVVVRATTWGVLVAAFLFCRRSATVSARLPGLLLAAVLMLALAQTVPLGFWHQLPGRDPFADAVAGGTDVSRPWAIVPAAAFNALGSLIVPLTTLLLVTRLEPAEYRLLPAILLGLMMIVTFVAMIQFSGVVFDNPLVNDTPGERSGTFANRNHYALFAALGCMVAPAWAFANKERSGWRAPFALGLVLIFALMILASGSRAGIIVGLLGLISAILITGQDLKRALRRSARWVYPAMVIGIVGIIVLVVLASVVADRAVSIDRLYETNPDQDMRSRGLSTVLKMIREYFPAGSGLGGFDSIFRIHEPLELLKPTFFNQAHNDFLEVVLTAGLPGAILLLATLGWWIWTSVRVWWGGAKSVGMFPRLGSAMLLLVIVASIVDYPARTPLVMTVIVIAAVWLADQPKGPATSALPC